MAFGQVGSIGAAQNKTAGTNVSLTVTGRDATAGQLLLIFVAVDNTTTTDGQTSDVGLPSDSQGNTYTKIGEFTNSQGSADAGATIALFYTIVTTTLVQFTDTVTSNVNASRAAKAIGGFLYTIGSGNTIQVENIQTLADDGADPGSMSISGLPNQEHLFVRAVAAESNTTTNISGTNYQQWSAATTTGGGSASNMGG